MHILHNLFFYIVTGNVATNFLQYQINEAFAIIKQTTSTISEPYKRTRYKYRVKIEEKKLKGKKDYCCNTYTLFNLT